MQPFSGPLRARWSGQVPDFGALVNVPFQASSPSRLTSTEHEPIAVRSRILTGDILFTVNKLAELAAESLAALTYMIEDDGRIRRCYSFRRNGNRCGYNQLRHAGTVWAMFSIF